MDRRLHETITRGDVSTLTKLIEQDEHILRQTVPGSLNTVLHLCARFGHLELAKEIIRTCPEMVWSENDELETPLYEACREGHLEIVKMLLEDDEGVVYKVNSRGESVFYVACEKGKIDVVKYLLSYPRLLVLEVDMATTSLHVAASSGNTETVKEILIARPDFAWKRNFQGFSPLHIACSKGHLEITKELIKLDSDLCLIRDNEGCLPLHHAAIKGRINIIAEIINTSLGSAEMTTFDGETILHLAVKNNQYEVVKYLTESINISRLLNMQDNDGNTTLHLATAGKLKGMVTYLLKIGTEVNSLNGKGYTALDVIEADTSNSGALAILPALLEAGAKRCDQLSPELIDIQVPKSSPKRSISCPNRPSQDFSPARLRHRRQNRRRARKLVLQNEGLRDARETITIVAVLIATVTFAAGINPPGGFNEDTGKAIRGNRAAFKVFLLCNIVALFLSIGVVNVLVSVIPFTRKTMVKLLSATHKVLWLSTLFMAAAYIAAIWTILPDEKGVNWVLVELSVCGGGCTIVVFLGLLWMLARHWHKKSKWRKERQKKMKKGSSGSSSKSLVGELMMKKVHSVSSNSDVDSSDHGYHLY